MKTVSVRDLRYNFKSVEALLRTGEELTVTRRRRAIARLVPENKNARLPDFLGRMQSTYGEQVMEASGAELVRLDRDR